MDFKDTLKQLSEKIDKLKDNIATEEATKNALIMPFISALGYDVFNPLEVLPEMDCDLIKKKGEKIDYAIFREGVAIMLIECKHWQQNLNLHDTQLQKYFVASKAKFGILTNGILYRFYTDLINQNIMDERPFLEINMLELKEAQIEELKKFHKSYFDISTILSSASELKYMGELKALLSKEFSNPSLEFVKYFGKQIYEGPFTSKVAEQFAVLLKRSVASHISDSISDRLKAAIKEEEKDQDPPETGDIFEEEKKENKVVTTDEEIESFFIVKSILRSAIAPERITYRDAQSYFAIFVDDNNRKPVCRLYLNSQTNKQLALLGDDKKETRHKIESIDQIYLFSDELTNAIEKFK